MVKDKASKAAGKRPLKEKSDFVHMSAAGPHPSENFWEERDLSAPVHRNGNYFRLFRNHHKMISQRKADLHH